MSRVQKLRAMEELWADISRDDDRYESPAWHKDALEE
ncbi:MAG TPA: addiction module protein, partial [Opitutaceae bacterium]|nr:addiction module protein [Opitutaceae bacterium]